MRKTRDDVIPEVGQTLYRVWHGDVESIKVLAFDVFPTASEPTVEYSDGPRKIRVSADVFYASLHVAWKAVKLEAIQAIDQINGQIRELLDDQIKAIDIIHKADKVINNEQGA